jgi:pectate lyase
VDCEIDLKCESQISEETIMKLGNYVKIAAFALLTLTCYCWGDVFPADGWAGYAGTTGGAGGTTVTVTTAASFKTYVESASTYIVKVSGTLDLVSVSGGVSIKSNKTIIGLDTSSTIIGRLGFLTGASNIIIQGLNITNPTYAEADGISVKNTVTKLFVTKCTIYDCGDGCLDISNQSDYVTVSWCKFYYSNPAPAEDHRFVNLIGSSDTPSPSDAGTLRVAMHHNWWSSRCRERMPRVRFGQVHVYNNYYGCNGNNYCVGVGNNSNIRVESNYFDSVSSPWADYRTNGIGIIGWNTDNYYVSTTVPTWATNSYTTIFVPPYTYTLASGSSVKATVTAATTGAGNTDSAHDNTAPTPNPATFLTLPYAASTTSIAMAANAGSDINGPVQYLFTETSGNPGGTSSGWQPGTTYTDTGLNPSTTYSYTIQMRDNAGNVGTVSSPASATTTTPPDTTPPAAPINLTAAATYGQISLNWDNNIEADLNHYNVYRSITSGFGFAQTAQVTDSNSVDTSVIDGTTYYYVVTAVDNTGNESDPSIEVDVTACMTIADFNCDGTVDIDDMLYMAGVWLTNDAEADIAQPSDGIVDLNDFSVLSQQWLK